MASVPVGRTEIASEAVLLATEAVPIRTPLLKNVTVPVGDPSAAGWTVAVSVTDCPVKAVGTFVITVVVVEACTAVPERRTDCGTEVPPPMTTEPLLCPTPVGRNATFCVQVAPGPRLIGGAVQEPPEAVVKGPVKLIEPTASIPVPLFDSVTG
jgi:hypothetical protein